MNYLDDNVSCIVNGKQANLAILVEDGHVIFFYRSNKKRRLNILAGGGILAGMTLGIAALPIALGALALKGVIDKRNKSELIEILNKVKLKFKISDDEIFISDSENCSVTLSGICTVLIEGVFITGETRKECKIEFHFSDRSSKKFVEEVFRKGNFRGLRSIHGYS